MYKNKSGLLVLVVGAIIFLTTSFLLSQVYIRLLALLLILYSSISWGLKGASSIVAWILIVVLSGLFLKTEQVTGYKHLVIIGVYFLLGIILVQLVFIGLKEIITNAIEHGNQEHLFKLR